MNAPSKRRTIRDTLGMSATGRKRTVAFVGRWAQGGIRARTLGRGTLVPRQLLFERRGSDRHDRRDQCEHSLSIFADLPLRVLVTP